MDYETHPLHEVISKNWRENRIPNMVLSCATLPKEDEIPETIMDFQCRFPNAEIKTITSYDCKKSIPILNNQGYCVLPHIMYSTVPELIECAKFCENNKTLLRYFEVSEIIRFLNYISPLEKITSPISDRTKQYNINLIEPYRINDYFTDIQEITMNSLKIYYLEILKNIDKFMKDPEIWTLFNKHMKETQEKKFGDYSTTIQDGNLLRRTQSIQDYTSSSSVSGGNIKKTSSDTSISVINNKPKHIVPNGAQGILLTTVDAHTLTDGPTIFLAEEIDKIGKFYVTTSKIPDGMLQNITNTIIHNDKLLKEIDKLDAEMEKKLQVKDNSGAGTESKSKNEKKTWDAETEDLMDKINGLRKKFQLVSMDPNYLPNTIPHQKVWVGEKNIKTSAFVPTVEEETVREIMQLEIDRTFKILVLLGIGVLLKQENSQYEEIVKRLANEQRLFIILASSDYIYGTNYSFCHGMIGKDLQKMTPQKTLQAMGRIGRNNIQQEYTIRFRDDDMILRLFRKPVENREAIVMQRLFS